MESQEAGVPVTRLSPGLQTHGAYGHVLGAHLRSGAEPRR